MKKMENDKQICPYCGEEIMASAKKCRYCGEWLTDVSAKTTELTPSLPKEPPTSKPAVENEQPLGAPLMTEPINEKNVEIPEGTTSQSISKLSLFSKKTKIIIAGIIGVAFLAAVMYTVSYVSGYGKRGDLAKIIIQNKDYASYEKANDGTYTLQLCRFTSRGYSEYWIAFNQPFSKVLCVASIKGDWQIKKTEGLKNYVGMAGRSNTLEVEYDLKSLQTKTFGNYNARQIKDYYTQHNTNVSAAKSSGEVYGYTHIYAEENGDLFQRVGTRENNSSHCVLSVSDIGQEYFEMDFEKAARSISSDYSY